MNKQVAQFCIAVDLALLVGLVIWRPWGALGMLVAATVLFTAAIGGLLLPSTTPADTGTGPGFAPRRVPDPQPEPVRREWDRAVEHHQDVLSAYGAYELDPAMLLQYPAMWDLSAAAVVAFHDALEVAGGLQTERYPGPDSAREYIDAVTMLRTSWAKADRYARSAGTSALPDADAQSCDRALKLLRHAEGTEGSERAAYLQQVISAVDTLGNRGVIHPPTQIQATLAGQVRKAIER